ncbi:hypothetical protein KU616_24130, partial [Salmonella enterica subsp. enterica serovar Mbandaka]|nr:hypothetical protein [Salmonella enterica subsp. enterica serovar Mbandaka]
MSFSTGKCTRTGLAKSASSNQGEKEEVVPEEKQPAAEPEAVTRNADGTFDVSALFPPPSN